MHSSTNSSQLNPKWCAILQLCPISLHFCVSAHTLEVHMQDSWVSAGGHEPSFPESTSWSTIRCFCFYLFYCAEESKKMIRILYFIWVRCAKVDQFRPEHAKHVSVNKTASENRTIFYSSYYNLRDISELICIEGYSMVIKMLTSLFVPTMVNKNNP